MEIAIIFYSLTEGDNLNCKTIVPSKTHKMSHQNIYSISHYHVTRNIFDEVVMTSFEDVGEL